MPVYEFRCNKCEKVFEKIFFSFKNKVDNVKCIDCGSKCKRIISKSSFKLSGSGWSFDNYQKK